MVAVVQLVERQIVILVVAGSSPVSHPIFSYSSLADIHHSTAFRFYSLRGGAHRTQPLKHRHLRLSTGND